MLTEENNFSTIVVCLTEHGKSCIDIYVRLKLLYNQKQTIWKQRVFTSRTFPKL